MLVLDEVCDEGPLTALNYYVVNDSTFIYIVSNTVAYLVILLEFKWEYHQILLF